MNESSTALAEVSREIATEAQTRRTYRSPFDRIDFQASFHLQTYEGSLAEVLDELEAATVDPDQYPHLANLALHPPRVIRAVVDYKVDNPEAGGILDLLREAIRLGLSIYREVPDTLEAIRRFRQCVTEVTGDQLLAAGLQQPSDSVTWHATSPERSQKTAAKIAEAASGEDVLFVALAHGGVAAGMDTYLRYCDLTGSADSEFYVARHSASKLNDREPRLIPEEIQYLQAQAVRRQVVIFDEDRMSGETLKRARAFFVTEVFPKQQVTVVTNLDARGELVAQGFDPQIKDQSGKDIIKKNEHLSITGMYKEIMIKNQYVGNNFPSKGIILREYLRINH